MKGFFKKLKEIYNHDELRKKILLTLGLILIYRIGCYIVLPGVDSAKVQEYFNGLGASSGGGLNITDILSLFTGGAFTTASIFALGIMPYLCFYYHAVDGDGCSFDSKNAKRRGKR
jgi:preprotein translocase subunit SecY